MRKIDLLLANSFDALVSKLEAFGNKFEQLATTADQRKLAAEFNAFAGDIIQELSPPGADYFLRLHGHESLSDLFAEIRADEVASRREDAHRYGKEAFKKILDGKSETPAAEMTQDKGIER
jgi:hypothetical protein